MEKTPVKATADTVSAGAEVLNKSSYEAEAITPDISYIPYTNIYCNPLQTVI